MVAVFLLSISSVAGVIGVTTGILALGLGIHWWRLRTRFTPSEFVWSRGLALLCDHNGGGSFVKNQMGSRPALRFDPMEYRRVKDGDLVWVRSTALQQFIDEALPRIKARFALVTGDEDLSIPSEVDRSRILLSHPSLLCWFAQNYDGTDLNPKLHPLPIGLDFHTIANKKYWGHRKTPPLVQEAKLKQLIKTMAPTRERILQVHSDFHLSKTLKPFQGENREDVYQQLKQNPLIAFQPRRLRRLDLWREKSRYAFCVSPHGNGLDCHRTWESLVLGNIVIVKTSSLDPLYTGLPVVILTNWNEITPENLQRWLAEHEESFQRTEVREKLTNRYWIDRVRRTAALELTESQNRER